ncbi:hypothetical protein [Streptomyces sp. NPDC048172]|uniref:hypothetical protein n=1 Tax=Streptomyces sp. NPDC048172 TaxID=3365505 RepID=UPI003719C5D7
MAEGGGGGQGQELSHSALLKLDDELDLMMGSVRTRMQKLDVMIDNLENQWRGIGRGAFDKVQDGLKIDLAALNRILAAFTDGVQGTSKYGSGNDQAIFDELKKLQSDDLVTDSTRQSVAEGRAGGIQDSKLYGL